jgi:16S rRNA processing protein RimM
MEQRILIGEISTVHGVKGLVKLRSYVDNTDLFSATLYTDEHSAKTIRLKLKNPMKDHWLAEVEGYNDRTAAESLRGTKIYIDRDALPALADDEHYSIDLIGMECIDESGQSIGTVIDVTNFGASDLLDIKPPSGPSFYLHYTDETVLKIGEKITIHIPEGLLD